MFSDIPCFYQFSVCGAELQVSYRKGQFFSHPNYGQYNYEGNADCVWVLKAGRGNGIRLKFKEFDVEGEKNCLYDYVTLRSGSSGNSPLLARICNGVGQRDFVIPGNQMWIEFKTDRAVGAKGFNAEYSIAYM